MTQKQHHLCWGLGLPIILLISSVFAPIKYATAQPIPDESLGAESSTVKTIDSTNSTQIDGGESRGSNLFHSFKEFNIGEEQTVLFNTPPGISNIITRVTGGSPSQILGTLGVAGNANLFLINPNGIIFGRNASLDLRGSFIASTASSVIFADGIQYSATNPQVASLLIVNTPTGLQYGRTNSSIQVRGATELKVQPNQTLALVGSDVIIEGGKLEAPDGKIELGSVAANSLISLNPIAKGWSFGYENATDFQNISITKGIYNTFASRLDASGNSGGDINLQGKQILLADTSQISSETNGAGMGGNLVVNASDFFLIKGFDTLLSTATSGTGDGGNITVNTDKLILEDGASILADSSSFVESPRNIRLATGNGGNLTVNAYTSVELRNGSALTSLTGGSGNAGNIKINTDSLIIGGILTLDGTNYNSGVSVSSSGTGDSGNLTIAARTISLNNGGEISAKSQLGEGGNIFLQKVNSLTLRGGSIIATDAQGAGNGGNIAIAARTISLDNGGQLTATSDAGKGGGNITLKGLESLLLRGGSVISTDARGEGNGGNINIQTKLLVGLENSDITANALGGKGGFIQIDAKGVFGLEVREQLTKNSDITAFSQKDPSLNGVVGIDSLENDLEGALLTLPAEPVNISGLIAQGCSSGGGSMASNSKFIVTGRGGLPPTPKEAFRGDVALADLGKPVETETTQAKVIAPTNQKPPESTPLVEAQGWVIGSKGEVILTASAPNVTPSVPWMKSSSCHG